MMAGEHTKAALLHMPINRICQQLGAGLIQRRGRLIQQPDGAVGQKVQQAQPRPLPLASR
jgi:hypothetical protein